jgi:hypothetical protein
MNPMILWSSLGLVILALFHVLSCEKKNQEFWIAYPRLELFWLCFVLAMSVTCHFSPWLYPQIKGKGDEYDSVQSFQFYLKWYAV